MESPLPPVIINSLITKFNKRINRDSQAETINEMVNTFQLSKVWKIRLPILENKFNNTTIQQKPTENKREKEDRNSRYPFKESLPLEYHDSMTKCRPATTVDHKATHELKLWERNFFQMYIYTYIICFENFLG